MNLHDATFIRLEGEREARIKMLEAEIALLRLTDAEREAIGRAIDSLEGVEDLLPTAAITDPADTLRGLLERLGGGR